MVRVEQDLLDRIDELRRAAPDLPSRPEVVRRLVEKALRAGEDGGPL
ncbi:ribbon-helix-helix protein, CopG family [Paracoccus sphaerophysae]|nr:ribbon-helix-helix protein, CopG family [Paracoccus sphaerophysae]